MIDVGDQLTLPGTGRALRVERLIGEGSQGAVFEARTPDGAGVALKWYFEHTGTPAQRAAIAELVQRGAPSSRFLWPSELVEAPGRPAFGYVMPLRPASDAGLVDLLVGRVDVPFSVVCRLGMELAGSFLALHAEGLCYRDISFSNVFFDPTTGVPLICDNDNVGIDGAGPAGVLGTRRFMAPEVVRREAAPSTDTDLYSLAVLLFYLFMMGHPLIGRRELQVECWDDRAESDLFGAKPVFVFDPVDRSNEAAEGVHDTVLRYWHLYPGFLRSLFVQAFTSGLHDPRNGRVRESVWRAALARLRDSIVRCAACAKENFVDPAGEPRPCWSCGQAVPDPLWLLVERRWVALGPGSRVYGHHLDGSYDYDTVVAEVTTHPQRADLLGLRNRGEQAWPASLATGEQHAVDPGRNIRVAEGTVIDLGGVRARILSRPRASVIPAPSPR